MWLVLVREVCSILIVTMPKMTVKFQEFLKNQIEVYIRKYPDCRVSDVREFILEGDQGVFDLALFPYKQQWNFINAQMKKFRETGSMKKRKGQGKKPLPQEKLTRLSKSRFTKNLMDPPGLLQLKLEWVRPLSSANSMQMDTRASQPGQLKVKISKFLKLFFYNPSISLCTVMCAYIAPGL